MSVRKPNRSELLCEMIGPHSHSYTEWKTVFCGQRIKVNVNSPGANPAFFIVGIRVGGRTDPVAIYILCLILRMTR